MKLAKSVGLSAAVAATVLVASAAHAQNAPFPTTARRYTSWMARAMDQCVPSGISVLGAAAGACLQANSVTDDTITMNFARIVVNSRTGRVVLFGRGFPAGAR